MKKNSTLRTMLGFSQMEMAELLNVNRSTYSMFELGKRDLPLASTYVGKHPSTYRSMRGQGKK